MFMDRHRGFNMDQLLASCHGLLKRNWAVHVHGGHTNWQWLRLIKINRGGVGVKCCACCVSTRMFTAISEFPVNLWIIL